MAANACIGCAFNHLLLSISSATSSFDTFSMAPSLARIWSSNGKIFSSCSVNLVFHFSMMMVYSSSRHSSASLITLVRKTRWPTLTFLLHILCQDPAQRTMVCGIFHCIRNISALAGSTNTQDCICRFLLFIAFIDLFITVVLTILS